MPTEKLVAWLVRALIAVGVAYVALVIHGYETRISGLEAKASKLEAEVAVAERIAEKISGIDANAGRIGVLELDSREARVRAEEFRLRLDKIDRNVELLLTRVR